MLEVIIANTIPANRIFVPRLGGVSSFVSLSLWLWHCFISVGCFDFRFSRSATLAFICLWPLSLTLISWLVQINALYPDLLISPRQGSLLNYLPGLGERLVKRFSFFSPSIW